MLKNETFNIFNIAKKNNFKRFMYFQVVLRDKIKYDIELIDSYVNLNIFSKNIEKHVIFACQTFGRINQSVPPKYNSSFITYDLNTYNYETSVIDIILECSDSEFKKYSNDITGKEKEEILFELLEFFCYKYNLATLGNDFINVCELCVGLFKCFLFYRNKMNGEYEHDKGVITPMSIIKSIGDSELNFQKVVNNEIPAWKFFVNKTKFNYLINNNLDCVINASIAIESYIIFLIKQNNKYKDYIKKYTNKLRFSSAIQFCLDNKIINNNLYDLIVSSYEKIGIYRCLIIHGVIDSPIIDREQAKKSYEIIVDIFSSINQELYNDKDLLSPDIYFENDYNMMQSIVIDYKNERYEDAIEKLTYNIDNNIFKDVSIFNRSKCYIALNRFDDAVIDLRECIANRYRMIESYFYLTIQLSKLNRQEEAKMVCLEALKLDDRYSEFYCNLGIVQQKLKEYDAAISSYKKALSLKKEARYYYNLGTAYFYKNDYDNCLLYYNKAIRLNSTNSEYLYERANLYEMLKNPLKAEKDIVKCLKFYQNIPDMAFIKERIFQIGVLYQKEEKYKDAIRMFNRGLKIENARDVYYQARGNCYKKLGMIQKAKNDYLKCLEISPFSLINLTNIIYLYLSEKDFYNAKSYLDDLVKNHGLTPNIKEIIDSYDYLRLKNKIIDEDEFLLLLKNRHLDITESIIYKELLNIYGLDETKRILKLEF